MILENRSAKWRWCRLCMSYFYVYTASKRDQKQKTENKTFIVTKNYFNVREQKNDVKPERKFIRVNIGKCLFLFGWKIFRWICANSMCFSPSHSLLPFLCSFLFFLRAQTHAHEKGRRKEEKKKHIANTVVIKIMHMPYIPQISFLPRGTWYFLIMLHIIFNEYWTFLMFYTS